MSSELKKATDLLLNKIYIQKGSLFENLVLHVTKNHLKNEILVTYKTINLNNDTTPVMELNKFLESHYI
jgi:hypothetical protein